MSHTAADLGLHGYKTWLKSLVPLSNGTVVRFIKGYDGSTASSTVKAGQEMIVTECYTGVLGNLVYKMVVCRNGKVFKKDVRFSVESIARWIIDNECEVV